MQLWKQPLYDSKGEVLYCQSHILWYPAVWLSLLKGIGFMLMLHGAEKAVEANLEVGSD